MYSSYQLARKYLQYYLHASNSKGHGMHSPFVFDFILHVLNNGKGYTPPAALEELRSRLKRDGQRLVIEDMGAGSRSGAAKERTVSQLARTALKPPKYAQLLHRLVRHYQPQTIIELGTSLGLTTAYLATGNKEAKVITIEGSQAIAARAAENFSALGLSNIESLQGNFDNLLPGVLNRQVPVDLAYVDGNHRYRPTVAYFHHLLQHVNDYSILVFDDIHWSAEMEKAWAEIQSHPSVQYTIDIFFLGFVFFRKEFRVKQHFSIRF